MGDMTQLLIPPAIPLPPQAPLPPTAEAGSYPDLPGTCPSVVEFVDSDPGRRLSRERDFGLSWREGREAYRAAWIEQTGELYTVQLGSPEHGGGHVRLLAVGAGSDDVERWLTGWRDRIDRPDSLRWLRQRVTDGIAAGEAKAPR